jgi:hypothetical protein
MTEEHTEYLVNVLSIQVRRKNFEYFASFLRRELLSFSFAIFVDILIVLTITRLTINCQMQRLLLSFMSHKRNILSLYYDYICERIT